MTFVNEIAEAFATLEHVLQSHPAPRQPQAHAAHLGQRPSRSFRVVSGVGGQLSHRTTVLGYHETLALLHPVQELRKMGLCVVCTDFRHVRTSSDKLLNALRGQYGQHLDEVAIHRPAPPSQPTPAV
jgi:hypothetical protein